MNCGAIREDGYKEIVIALFLKVTFLHEYPVATYTSLGMTKDDEKRVDNFQM